MPELPNPDDSRQSRGEFDVASRPAMPTELIHRPSRTTVSSATMSGFLALLDMSSTVADAMDALGCPDGVIVDDRLAPMRDGDRMVGQAVTLRYEPYSDGGAWTGAGPRLGDQAAVALAQPGDVLVIETGGDASHAVVGQKIATRILRAGIAGCLCGGAIRDSGTVLSSGLPVWAVSRSPRSALRSLQAAEVNGPVTLGAITIGAGDLIVADVDGVVVVPPDRADAVLAWCQEQEASEAAH